MAFVVVDFFYRYAGCAVKKTSTKAIYKPIIYHYIVKNAVSATVGKSACTIMPTASSHAGNPVCRHHWWINLSFILTFIACYTESKNIYKKICSMAHRCCYFLWCINNGCTVSLYLCTKIHFSMPQVMLWDKMYVLKSTNCQSTHSLWLCIENRLENWFYWCKFAFCIYVSVCIFPLSSPFNCLFVDPAKLSLLSVP